ncbi:hypothetical protein C8Q80DRAFT_20500 [Daedaleopsis nitida]|nr:hypothetical protein C8Q80DRAFT_20500 [Daedaleopsis nitida]
MGNIRTRGSSSSKHGTKCPACSRCCAKFGLRQGISVSERGTYWLSALCPLRLAGISWACVQVYYAGFRPGSSLRRWLELPMEMIWSMSDGLLCFRNEGRGGVCVGVCVCVCGQRVVSRDDASSSWKTLLAFLSALSGGRGVATSIGIGNPEPGDFGGTAGLISSCGVVPRALGGGRARGARVCGGVVHGGCARQGRLEGSLFGRGGGAVGRRRLGRAGGRRRMGVGGVGLCEGGLGLHPECGAVERGELRWSRCSRHVSWRRRGKDRQVAGWHGACGRGCGRSGRRCLYPAAI